MRTRRPRPRKTLMNTIKAILLKELQDAGWHSRGYLPHFNGSEIPQTVTFRLADSLPINVIERWKEDLAKNFVASSELILRKRIDRYLDQGRGSCALKSTRVAGMVQESLLHFDGARYQLSAWVVMPNHLHTLLTPKSPWSLSRIMKDRNRLLPTKRIESCSKRVSSGWKTISTVTSGTKSILRMPSHTSRIIQSRLGYAERLTIGRSVALGSAHSVRPINDWERGRPVRVLQFSLH